MAQSSPYRIVLSTCPEGENAESLARALVEQGLAACVNIIPGLRSVYRWKGTVETSDEALLLIKTDQERYAQLERALQERHPYELPEILSVAIDNGLTSYLAWIGSSLVTKE